MKEENLSTIAFLVGGIIAGFASFLLKNNLNGLAASIIIYAVSIFLIQNFGKMNKDVKWFFTSGGGWIYFFIWFIVWVILYNL